MDPGSFGEGTGGSLNAVDIMALGFLYSQTEFSSGALASHVFVSQPDR